MNSEQDTQNNQSFWEKDYAVYLWVAEEKKYNKPYTYNVGGITVC
jgi:hypothetical protein